MALASRIAPLLDPRRRALFSWGLAALVGAQAPSARAQVAPHGSGRVVATFSVLADIAREVAPEGVQVHALVGHNADAHVFEPGPHHARLVKTADIVIVNGLGLEGWISRLVRASGFQGRLVVASEGLKTLNAQAHAGKGHHHHAYGPDPHAWQDLAHGASYARTIAKAMMLQWPAQRDAIEARLKDYVARIDALDASLRATLSAIPREQRRVVTSHDAFQYLGAAYSVDFFAPQGWTTGAQPSAAAVGRLIRLLQERGARAVFVENISDPRLVRRIADEARATVGGTLYSDALSAPEGPAGTYLAMVRHNVESIARAIQAAPANAASQPTSPKR